MGNKWEGMTGRVIKCNEKFEHVKYCCHVEILDKTGSVFTTVLVKQIEIVPKGTLSEVLYV